MPGIIFLLLWQKVKLSILPSKLSSGLNDRPGHFRNFEVVSRSTESFSMNLRVKRSHLQLDLDFGRFLHVFFQLQGGSCLKIASRKNYDTIFSQMI